MIDIFKANLNESTAKKWYNLFQKHQETLENICNNRDLFMNHELKYSRDCTYSKFLNLFEHSIAFRKHDFQAKINFEGFILEHKKPPIKLFAFLSGGILPYCLDKTNEFDDIDIYLSTDSFTSRDRGEFRSTGVFINFLTRNTPNSI